MNPIIKECRIVLLFLLTITCSIKAQDFVVNGVCYHLIDNNGEKCAEVTQGTQDLPEYNGIVAIPETVAYQGVDYTVTSIDALAFWKCDDLTTVTLPNTLTRIGYDAFYGCSNLTSITLPESLMRIEEEGFGYCGLTSIYIPKNVTTLERNVFIGCSKMCEITVDPNNNVYDSRGNCNAVIQKEDNLLIIGCMNTVLPPDNFFTIGPRAFYNCVGLTHLDFSFVNGIDYDAFHGCENLTSITLDNVSTLGDGAFSGCTSLTSIHIPKYLTSLGENTFVGCSGITSITVDEGNNKYDSRDGCNAIIDKKYNELLVGCQNTIIPYGIETIGSNAFNGCSTLTAITIPSTVTKIHEGAFSGCKGLKSIVIPAGITKINSTTFNNCNELASIVVEDGNTVYDSRNNCNAIIETATNKLIIGCSTTVIPSDVTEISYNAFRGNAGLTSIIIPDAVTKIRRYAFAECTSLSSVILSKNLNSIEENAFWNCSSLKEIIIPNGVTKLDNYIFESCSSLSSVSLPDGLTEIDANVFGGTALKAITLPATLTTIQSMAFYYCRGLTDVTFKSPTPIPVDRGNLFYNISNITLYVPKGSKAAYEAADYWKDFKEIKEVSDSDGDYVLGDANNDGKLTIADYTAIAHHILGRTPDNFNEKAANVNGDNKINMADYIGVVHLLLYGTIEKPTDK